MTFGDKVSTKDGNGTFIEKEAKEGFLSHRFFVRLDNPPIGTRGLLHDVQGGLYYYDNEVRKI